MDEPLSYATPDARRSSPIGVAVVLGMLALGMIGLGGCFMIGIGAMYDIFALAPSKPRNWTPGEITFVSALYAATAACFAGAFYLLALCIKRLLTA